MVVKWQFQDATIGFGDSYTFEINPNEGGSPNRQKSIGYQKTTAPDGKTIVFEGRDEPMTTTVSGTILNQGQVEAFQEWFDRRHAVRLTDDLGRVYIIYITQFEPKRVRSRSFAWKHTYTLSYTVLQDLGID